MKLWIMGYLENVKNVAKGFNFMPSSRNLMFVPLQAGQTRKISAMSRISTFGAVIALMNNYYNH